jgi:hypothetical protein
MTQRRTTILQISSGRDKDKEEWHPIVRRQLRQQKHGRGAGHSQSDVLGGNC